MDQPISLENVISFLVATPLFSDLDSAELSEVVRIMQVQRLNDSQKVFRENEAGDAWYVIFEGQAEVLKEEHNGPARKLALLNAGACFGEMAILDGSPRSATVHAVGPLTLFGFRRAQFEELLEQGSLAAYKLVAAMARLLSERHRRLTHEISDLMGHDEPAVRSARLEIGPLVDRYTVSE